LMLPIWKLLNKTQQKGKSLLISLIPTAFANCISKKLISPSAVPTVVGMSSDSARLCPGFRKTHFPNQPYLPAQCFERLLH